MEHFFQIYVSKVIVQQIDCVNVSERTLCVCSFTFFSVSVEMIFKSNVDLQTNGFLEKI